MQEKLTRVSAVLAKVLRQEVGGLTAETPLKTYPGMDSMKLLQFVVALEKEFKLRFDTRFIIELSTVGDILRKIPSNG